MQVRLLGPVDLMDNGASRPVRGLRRKAVLAVLALHRGEVASTDRLVDAVWGDDAPSTSANTLQSHVSYLRRVLGSKTAVLARPPGYLLDLGVEGTDVQVAERLIQQGRQAAERGEQAALLRAALALWRGRPLADVTGLPWLEEQAEVLNQLWLQATRALIDARLALGEHPQVLPDLEQLARDHPFDEQIHGQHMLALYRNGRQADALAAYHRLRRTLDDDLGIEPSQALRDLQTGILNQDPALDPATPPIVLAPPPVPVPAQLPLAAPAFAGRTRELAELDANLPPTDPPSPTDPTHPTVNGQTTANGQNISTASTAMVISAVSGTAGVGKTALALHWAHRVADRFPDGQLYVNLRGFDPSRPMMDPTDAVRSFLDALDVPPERIPADLDAQTAMYRSRLAGRRMLIVLDNAHDSGQVRPLLPGTPSCLVLVTSRSQLTGLVAADGAHPVPLDLLPPDEARELLSRRLGADRVAAEPGAVSEIINRCARLPLALAILAAHAATRPQAALHTLAAELRHRRDRLDTLTTDDPNGDLRAVFSWSYSALTPDAAQLFRLLGLHPGPDIAAPAAASLTALPPRQVRPLLAELSRANLVVEHLPGRYSCHDLLRAYATDLTHRLDTEQQRRAAVHRALDHYLHLAHAADRLLEPARDPLPLPAPQPGVTLTDLADHRQALAWFTAEHAVLLATVDRAAATGWDAHATQLAWTLATYLYRHGHWHDQATAGRAAVAAAQRLADPAAQARAHRNIAAADFRLGRFDAAHHQLGQALELGRQAGDLVGQAHTLHYQAAVWEEQGQLEQALEHDRRALELYRAAGHQQGQANALNKIGWDHVLLGDHQEALGYCQQALAMLQQLGDRVGQAGSWDSLGYAQHHLGQHAEAVRCYQQALNLYRDLGDCYLEADTVTHLGDTHHAAGDFDAARDSWRQALGILDALGHPDAEPIRAKLADLDEHRQPCDA